MAKNKKRSKRRAQEADAVDTVEETASNEASEVGKKNLLELSADELKKEAFKLGLFVDGDKPRKDQALTKLTAFLSRNGINIETFQFSSNGATQFPAPLLSENRARADQDKVGSSSSSSSGSSSEEDEQSLAKTRSTLKKKKTKANKTTSSNLNIGFETLINPVTGAPVGIVSKTTGQFYGVSVPGAGPATAIPATSNPANPSPVPTTGVIAGHGITVTV